MGTPYTVHTFGYGKEYDPKLMTEIADLKDGDFYYIKELHEVNEAFLECLGGLGSVVGKNLELRIT